MSILTGGLRKVCFANPANGDRVVVSKISSGSTSPEPDVITSATPSGAVFGGLNYNYTIGFFDYSQSIIDQFVTWENADTEVIAILLYDNAVRFWLDPTPISGFIDSMNMNAQDGVSPFTVNLLKGYSDPNIYLGVNFLRAAAKRNVANKTQLALTTDYTPLIRSAGTSQFRLDMGFGNFGISSSGGATLKLPFPFPGETFNIGMTTEASPASFTVASLLFNNTVVNSSTFDTDGSTNQFTVGAGAYWLSVVIPNEDIQTIFARLKGTGNTIL
jgi:hypothetical protein